MSLGCSCTGGSIHAFHELQNALLMGKSIEVEFHEVLGRFNEVWVYNKEADQYICTIDGEEVVRCHPSRFAARVQDDMVAVIATKIF